MMSLLGHLNPISALSWSLNRGALSRRHFASCFLQKKFGYGWNLLPGLSGTNCETVALLQWMGVDGYVNKIKITRLTRDSENPFRLQTFFQNATSCKPISKKNASAATDVY